jgi:hypothetical protein
MTTWRHFARRELPRVVRELGIPCAEPVRVTGMNRCPRHEQPLGPTSRMCLACHDEAWNEVARRYRAQGKPVTNTQPEGAPMNTTSTELAPLEPDEMMPAPPPITLFGTTDPRLARERMADLASVLVDVVKDRGLSVRINGKDFLPAEAWTTLGGLLGVVPVVEWTRPNESGDGYVARVEARTLEGRVVGAAESECSRAESRWKTRDAFQLRSMAQTRAIGRALRAPLGMIPVLAGYEATSADEMSVDAREPEPEPAGPIPADRQPTEDQKRELRELIERLDELDADTDWLVRCRELAGVPGPMLTATIAADLIDRLHVLRAQLEESHDGESS